MNQHQHISDELKDKIKGIGKEVSKEDIDCYKSISEAENRRTKFINILDAWNTQTEQERKLRIIYSISILSFLALQIIIVNLAFFFIGFGYIKVDQWVANCFILSVFGEISAIFIMVVNYLFPKTGTDINHLIDNN